MMQPECTVRLRLIGFTPEGIRALESRYPAHANWMTYVEILERMSESALKTHTAFWNGTRASREE
jgi:hypothetical protein